MVNFVYNTVMEQFPVLVMLNLRNMTLLYITCCVLFSVTVGKVERSRRVQVYWRPEATQSSLLHPTDGSILINQLGNIIYQ